MKRLALAILFFSFTLSTVYAQTSGFEAIKLLAEQGDPSAQFKLGFIFVTGEGGGVLQDYDEAIKWFTLAAEQGHPSALYKLGLMYYRGEGVAKNKVYAYMWFSLAIAHGQSSYTSPRETRDALSRSMTPEEIVSAELLADKTNIKIDQNRRQAELAQDELESRRNEEEYARSEADKINNVAGMVSMTKDRGTFLVPVLINNTITLNFTVDSGAADVTIPADVFSTLMRAGTITKEDFLGEKIYVLADGSEIPSQTFRIRTLKVGDKVIENVEGGIVDINAGMLLGQSFLSRFKSWSIDNNTHTLILE